MVTDRPLADTLPGTFSTLPNPYARAQLLMNAGFKSQVGTLQKHVFVEIPPSLGKQKPTPPPSTQHLTIPIAYCQ